MKKLFFLLIAFAFLISTQCFAQQGWWTLMKGQGASQSGSYGTQGVAATANIPPSMYKTDACWTDAQGKMWFYGGDLGASALWKYDPVTNNWTWIKGPNTYGVPPVYGTKGVPAMANNPPVVSTGSALTWIDALGNFWLWGGGLGAYADMWKYNPTTNMWTWMHGPGIPTTAGSYGVQGVSSPANLPPARYETSTSWTDNAGNFWMFGGGTSTGQMSDMWKYNPTTNEWTWMKGPSTAGNIVGSYGVKGVAAGTNFPPCRWSYCRWTDNAGNFWMFGGTGVNNNTDGYNDMWKFDPLTNNWTWMSGTNLTNQAPALPTKCVASTTNYPQSRYENPIAWKDKCGNLWMFSGQWTAGTGSQNKSDVWCYKIATNEWVFVGGNVPISAGTQGVPAGSNFPGDSYGAGAFSYNNEFWFVGGRGNGGGNTCLLWKYIPDSSCAKSFCNPQSPDPTANFNADSLIGCAPLTVYFTNTSTNATIWTWNFGDGNTSNAQHPTHTYTNPGNYTVYLVASDGTNDDTLTFVNYVNVLAPAVASTTILPNDTVCLGQSVTFINTSTNASSYLWSIPGQVKDTSTNFSYTFTPVGTHQIFLYANHNFGCNDIDTINIVVLNGFASTQSVSICNGNTYTLPGGNIVSTAGTYVDTLGSGGACDSLITTVLSITPPYTVSNPAAICNGDSVLLPSGNYASIPGTYIDTMNAVNGCDSIITTVLSITPPYTVSNTAAICNGDSVMLPGGNYVIVPGTYIDTLNAVNGCDSIITTVVNTGSSVTATQNQSICMGANFVLPGGTSVSVAGTYLDTIPSSGGCDSIITTNLTINPNSSSTQNPVVCSGTPFVLPSGISVSTTGIYSDTLIAKNGCDSIVTTNLTVNVAPNASVSADVTIVIGNTTTLSASGGGNYAWSPATGLNNATGSSVIASPSASTLYCVTVTNASGCSDSACVNVFLEITCGEIYVPNAFSPNDDNENDFFMAYVHPECIKEYKMVIYNRWGEKVFETTDVTQGWNGEMRGKDSNPGVYAFYCRAVFTSGKEFTKEGNVSLVK